MKNVIRKFIVKPEKPFINGVSYSNASLKSLIGFMSNSLQNGEKIFVYGDKPDLILINNKITAENPVGEMIGYTYSNGGALVCDFHIYKDEIYGQLKVPQNLIRPIVIGRMVKEMREISEITHFSGFYVFVPLEDDVFEMSVDWLDIKK
jgi:hypothetical protein